MVKEILVSKIMSDEEIASKEGEYFSESHYKKQGRHIIKEDCDVYEKVFQDGKWKKGKILLKFRKNVIPKNLTDMALEAYREASKKKHENRGAAAGPLDRKKMPAYIGEFINPGKFRTGFVSAHSGKKSKQATSNLSQSNIVGFFDVPDRNLKGKGAPCRLTAFNRDNPELWKKSVPFLQRCNQIFKELLPKRHQVQFERAKKTPDFVIPDTAFSTVTINYSWRTGLHRDAGDLKEGFGNLVVIEDTQNRNKYKGCYLGFPQFGVAVDPRTGDFLAMDVHEWHSNTEFKAVSNMIAGKQKEKDLMNDWYFNRLSIVMYLREKMIRCQDKSLWKNKAGGGEIGHRDKIKNVGLEELSQDNLVNKKFDKLGLEELSGDGDELDLSDIHKAYDSDSESLRYRFDYSPNLYAESSSDDDLTEDELWFDDDLLNDDKISNVGLEELSNDKISSDKISSDKLSYSAESELSSINTQDLISLNSSQSSNNSFQTNESRYSHLKPKDIDSLMKKNLPLEYINFIRKRYNTFQS